MATAIMISQQMHLSALATQTTGPVDLGGIHRTITTFLAIGYGRFWGTDGHCLHLYIHQAPVDSSKPMVIQMALMKSSGLQDKTKDMNVERELVRRNGGWRGWERDMQG